MGDILRAINTGFGKLAKLTLDPGSMFAAKLTEKTLDYLFPKPPEIAATNSGTAQFSGFGGNIPYIIGRVGISGNLFWLENNALKKTVHTTTAGGGKGGGHSEQKIHENLYWATFAIGLGYVSWPYLNNISGSSCIKLRRVWISNNLVFNGDIVDPGDGSGGSGQIVIKGQAANFTFYSGKLNAPNSRMQATLGSDIPAYNNLCYIVIEDMPLKQFSDTLQAANMVFEIEVCDSPYSESIYSNCTLLPHVVKQLKDLNAAPLDISYGEGFQNIRGVVVKGDVRAVLDSINQVFNWNMFASGYGMKGVYKSDNPADSVVTIPWADVGCREGGNQGDNADLKLLSQSIEMSTQQPRDYKIEFIDYKKEYTTNTITSQNPYAATTNVQSINTPVIMNEQHAQDLAQLLKLNSVVSSDVYEFSIPQKYTYLEPSDIIELETAYGYSIFLKITNLEDSRGTLNIQAKPIRGSVLSITDTSPITDPTVVPENLKTLLKMLDAPCLSSANNETGLLWSSSEYGPDMPGIWSGCQLVGSNDGEVTFLNVGVSTKSSIVGTIPDETTLPVVDGSIKQIGGYLNLVLNDPTRELTSVTEKALLNGANIALYGVSGRWEVVRFKTAELQMDQTYNLSTFMRGCNGTEWTIGLHAPNDIFVLIDPNLINFLSLETSQIEFDIIYRAVTYNMDLASADSVPQIYHGVNLKPLSGCKAKVSRSAGDVTLSWFRRTRIDGEWRNGVEISLSETTESYEVDVMNGPVIVRTIAATSPTISYTAAEQTTDFGSPQDPITFRIYQLSSVVGRGYKYEVTL